MNLFIQNLSHIPEDKLSWKPTLTAKSALEIAAHCAGYSAGFAMIIQNGRFPEDVNEFTVPVQERIESIKTVQ